MRFVYNWCILCWLNKLHHTWDNTKRFPFSKPAHDAFGLFLSVPIKIKGCTVTLNDVWGIKCQDHIRSHEKTFFRAYIYFYLALYCPYFTFTELLHALLIVSKNSAYFIPPVHVFVTGQHVYFKWSEPFKSSSFTQFPSRKQCFTKYLLSSQ